METPSPILVIALISAIGGPVFLTNSLSGINNWLTNSISSPIDSPGLFPIASAIGKDLMLDVSPQLHPSVFVGQSANQVKYQHWLDQDIHCEDCLKLEMPNTGNKIGVAFSSTANYNFEEARKVKFYVMVEDEEEGGATFSFKAVGNDRDNGTTTNVPADDLFKNQEFAVTSQNVTLNQSWNYFEMSLEGVQEKLGNVKYPFALELAQAEGDVIYIKGIAYSNEPILEQYLLEASSSDNMTASTMAVTATNATALNVTLSDNATETVNAPATVEFNATVADGEEPYSFDWDFGDGAEDTEDTDGDTIHTFAEPGSYNVTVDVADSLNNTGSANTVVDVADEIVNNEEPAVTTTTSPEGNLTQESQTADSLNTTNTTAGTAATAADDDESLTEGEAEADGGNNTGSSTVAPDGEVTSSNSPPIANAGNDLTGRPNERVILDASKSTDPDEGDRIESYQWEQESGPTAAIDDKNSQTPIVTLPDVDNDATLVFSLTVNDGVVDSEEQDTVSINVDHIDELTGNIQTRILKPADIETSEWIVADDCAEQGHVECLSDGSDATFVTAGIENIDAFNLYSFQGFNEGGVGGAVVDPNTLVIERVAAEITAKKVGNTGYVSLAIDEPSEEEHYITPSISIASSSFQKHNYVWDVNPLTGEEWTSDSLNSLVAGFKYDGGQSGVQISEIQLIISYSIPESSPPAEVDAVEDTSDSEANENEQNDEDNTNAAENPDDEEQQPEAEADSNNSTDSGANDEGSESEE
jgi:PKD domain